MEIKRDSYLQKLIHKQANGLIKVVTGVRRCGKSYLLFTLFHNYLLENGVDEKHIMENIIYNELRIRGFRVDVGLVEVFGKDSEGKTTKKQYEVDFVATMGSRKYYIQSAFAMPTTEKIEQEQRPFLSINDFFKKIIVVRDNIKVRRNDYGITTMGIINFLLDENSLEL